MTDSSGRALDTSNARLVQTPLGWEIRALSVAATGFELSYDAAQQHAVQVVRGERFGPEDLYLVVTSVPGIAAVGGFSFAPGELPAGGWLVARVVLQDGPAINRAAAALPTSASCVPAEFSSTDEGNGTVTFSWLHQNTGDYDQDGEVNIADLTPVGMHFHRVSGEPTWPAASLADGDGNGEVNVADLTPIGQHFKTLISGYMLERGAAVAGPFSTVVATLAVNEGAAVPRRTFACNLTPVDGAWYRVRAFSADDPSVGAASEPLQVSLLPPGVNPVAIVGTDKTSGPVPLTVSFNAAGSSDADGLIVKYEWDLDGDNVYESDATAAAGSVQHEYQSQGTFPVRLKVTDNEGRIGNAAIVINAGPPPDAVAPAAKAYVMPDEGWLPLTVQLSPFGSTDNIAVAGWAWDLDGDGTFETDATADAGYASTTFSTAGVKTISLQVADAEGNSSTASVTVSVLDPASATVDYDNVFRAGSVDRIDLVVTQGNWDAMWVDPQAELEVPADLTVFGELLPNIGLSMKGNSSLNGPGEKKPWKLDINDNDPLQTYHNMKEMVLNNGFKDPSLLRERMAYDLLYQAGVASSHASSVELWIKIGGAVPEFFGVYTLVERVDKKFIDNRYFDESGNLYKCDGGDLTWKGSSISAYPLRDGESVYAKRTNEEAADWSDVINLIDVINNTPDGEFPAQLEAVFNVDTFLRYLAVMLSTCNLDTYLYMSQNYYLYNNPSTGKFEWIPWDQNESWGLFGSQSANQDHPLFSRSAAMSTGKPAPLFDRVMEVEAYRQDYAAYLDLLRRTSFDYEVVRPRASALHDLLRPHVIQGDKMEYPVSAFDSNWDTDYTPGGPGFAAFGIAHFTQLRNDFVDAHLLADL